MSRNIVLLSDGTGNSAGKLFRTNVWRVYQALVLSETAQVAYYDDGVGTSIAAFGEDARRGLVSLRPAGRCATSSCGRFDRRIS
jgi:uncharacterized protein (DUF2235 family)